MAASKQSRTAWVVISTGAPITGGFAAAQLLTIARSEPNEFLGWVYSISAGLVFLAGLAIAIVAKVRDVKGALTADEARKAKLIQLRDQLMPMASTIADMARHPLKDRQPYLESVAKVAASALAAAVGDHVDRPRAVVYVLDADSPSSMKPIAHIGRGERPGPFVAGTVRGDAALNFLDGHRATFYEDLASGGKPAGYDGTMNDYKTFVAVPVWTETGVYGMVTLDAPSAFTLDSGDVALTELVAELMAAAFEVAQDQDAPPPKRSSGMTS